MIQPCIYFYLVIGPASSVAPWQHRLSSRRWSYYGLVSQGYDTDVYMVVVYVIQYASGVGDPSESHRSFCVRETDERANCNKQHTVWTFHNTTPLSVWAQYVQWWLRRSRTVRERREDADRWPYHREAVTKACLSDSRLQWLHGQWNESSSCRSRSTVLSFFLTTPVICRACSTPWTVANNAGRCGARQQPGDPAMWTRGHFCLPKRVCLPKRARSAHPFQRWG